MSRGSFAVPPNQAEVSEVTPGQQPGCNVSAETEGSSSALVWLNSGRKINGFISIKTIKLCCCILHFREQKRTYGSLPLSLLSFFFQESRTVASLKQKTVSIFSLAAWGGWDGGWLSERLDKAITPFRTVMDTGPNFPQLIWERSDG